MKARRRGVDTWESRQQWMNGELLRIEHGAPLRLRVEHQLGYKMAKWVNRIELVADCRGIGKGQGGWRDDVLNYNPSDAGI